MLLLAVPGPVDPRTACPFAVTEQQGLQRLRYYLGLGPPAGTGTSAGDAVTGGTGRAGGDIGGRDSGGGGHQEQGRAGAPIQTYQETRMMVSGKAQLAVKGVRAQLTCG